MRKLCKQATIVRNYSELRKKRADMLLSPDWSNKCIKDFEAEYPDMQVKTGMIQGPNGVMKTGFCGQPVGENQVYKYIRQYFTHYGFYPGL